MRSFIIGCCSILTTLTVGWLLYIAYKPAYSQQKDKFHIVCTTSIIANTVQSLVGDNVYITTLMGPDIDPHVYRPKERDIHALASADLIIYNGLHLEGKLSELLASMNHYVPTYAAADIVAPSMRITSPENPTIPDPHVWFSIPLWRIIARGITEQLVHYDNTHQAVYRHLGTQFDLSLQQLDTQIRTTLAVLPPENRILVTAHDAFHYFGREYGFIVVALQGISTETESGIYDVHELVTYIVDHKIPAIFVESSIPEKNLYAVQEACAARGWQIRIGAPLYSDALGPLGSNADTYEGMMTHNLRSLMQSLQTEK